MPWLLASPGHQQPKYCPCNTGRPLSSSRKDFIYLHHLSFEKLYEMQIYIYRFLKKFIKKMVSTVCCRSVFPTSKFYPASSPAAIQRPQSCNGVYWSWYVLNSFTIRWTCSFMISKSGRAYACCSGMSRIATRGHWSSRLARLRRDSEMSSAWNIEKDRITIKPLI